MSWISLQDDGEIENSERWFTITSRSSIMKEIFYFDVREWRESDMPFSSLSSLDIVKVHCQRVSGRKSHSVIENMATGEVWSER
jgi:hypothetical protein